MITCQNRPILSMITAAVVLTACAEKEVILPGERIAITASNAADLSVDADAGSENPGLAAIISNNQFVAPGLGAGHSGGHLNVELPLDRLFSTKVGVATDATSELAQPVADATAVYTITHGGVVTATDAVSGDRRWQVDLDPSTDDTQTSTSGGIALANGDIIVHASKDALYSLKAENGQENWRVDFPVFLADGPTVSNGVILLTDMDGKLYALSQTDGEELWSRIGTQDATRITGAAFPAVDDNEVIASGGDGEVLSLSLNQGEFLWGENLTPLQLSTALDSIPDLRTHPIHDGGLVFIATPSANIFAFNANTGREVWQKPLRVLEMPWLSGQTLYMTTIDGRLYALRRQDGAIRWVVELPGAFDPSVSVSEDTIRYTSPIVVSGQVMVASSRGSLLSFDAATGDARDVMSIGSPVTTAPIVANKTLYILTRSGHLMAWQ